MERDNDTEAESQDTPEQDQQGETGELTLFKVSIPAVKYNNAKKAMMELMSPFWHDIKEMTHASFQARTARLQLSRLRSNQKIRQILQSEHGSEVLWKVLLNAEEDQQRVDRVVMDGLKRVAENQNAQNTPPQPEESEEPKEIATGWLRRFRKEVEGLGDDDMEEAFARLLAGEIENPGSFSMRTIRTLGNLSQDVAVLFRKAVSTAVIFEAFGFLGAYIYGFDGDLDEGTFYEHGLLYSALAKLTEDGLLSSDRYSYQEWPLCLPIKCQNAYWRLDPLLENTQQTQSKRFHGVAFTTVGTELIKIVEIEPNPAFIDALRNHLRSQGLAMRPADVSPSIDVVGAALNELLLAKRQRTNPPKNKNE